MSYHVPEVRVYIHLWRVGVYEVAEHYGPGIKYRMKLATRVS